MISFKNDCLIEPTYDNVNQLPYLDMFIKEVLRMYPITPALARRCTNATQVKDLEIPEDLCIIVDVLSMHYDQPLWGSVDTKEFYPERFCSACIPLSPNFF